jgi:hypothetical protein
MDRDFWICVSSVSSVDANDLASYRCAVSSNGLSTNSDQANLTLKSYKGDLDGDCDVDGLDMQLLLPCLTGPDLPMNAGCSEADTDHDGDVDASDLGLLRGCMAGSGIPPSSSCAN